MAKQFYSIAEAAALLGISRVAVFNKVKKGVLPAEKVGRAYIIPAHALSIVGEGSLTTVQKKNITHGVKKVVQQYGKTLQLLAQE